MVAFVFIFQTVFPKIAEASFFEVITTLFAKEKDQTINASNTQNLQLLNAEATQKNDSSTTPEEGGYLAVTSGPLRMSTEEEVYIPESDAISIYVVKDGDTLNSIAKLFDVSVNTIVWANNISSRKVSKGDVLTILPVSGIRYNAFGGETISSIAKKYGASVDEVALYNGLSVDTVVNKGDVVLIPDGEIEEAPKKEEPKKLAKTEKKTSKIVSSVKKIVNNLSRSNDGSLVRPVKGGTKTQGIHGKNAVDIAAPVGTPIYAAAGGTVITVKTGGYDGGYGDYAVIRHSNGVQTLYAHMSATYVRSGQVVAQGEQIGAVGSTGKSTGPHLHFEVRGAINPF